MIRINPAQKDALRDGSRARFEEQMLAHIRRVMPDRLKAPGEGALRETIRYGIERARTSEIHTGPGVGLYIVLMLYLGSDFGDDPRLPWARDRLARTHQEESRRLLALREDALEFLMQAEGVENEHLERALRRIRGESLDALFPPRGSEALTAYLGERLRGLQPEKHAASGGAAMERLARASVETARSFSIEDDRTTAIVAAFMFMLGHRFHRDPQFPWLRKLFEEEPGARAALTAHRLHRAAIAHIEGVEG